MKGGENTMMGNFYGCMDQNMGWFGFLGFLTWLALFLFFALGAVYFWKQLSGKK